MEKYGQRWKNKVGVGDRKTTKKKKSKAKGKSEKSNKSKKKKSKKTGWKTILFENMYSEK